MHELRSYQEKAINEIKASLNKNKITVLAACPGAGKNLYIIKYY
jgi:superfamily II DNA or RNA helicase